jgi:26S proteasome regulatory subunit N2
MTKDPVDFVRQGASISLAMILIQHTEAQSPHVAETRKLFEKVVSDKHEDSLAKFGAAMSQGIIDAGGRNVTISLQSKAGTPNMASIVGMALFCQFWYWFPLAHCLSLSFTPTAVIGLDSELRVSRVDDVQSSSTYANTSFFPQIPKIDIVSNAKPSMFAYPSPYKPPAKEKVEKVATAVLSTTAKAQARAKTKEQEKAGADGVDAMDTVSERNCSHTHRKPDMLTR